MPCILQKLTRYYFSITFCKLAVTWSGLVQSTTCCHISFRFTLMVSCPLYWGLTSCLFHQVLPSNRVYKFLFSCIYTMCPAYRILLDLINRLILCGRHSLWIISLCSFPQSHLTSSVLGPSIFVSTLVSNTLNQCSSIYMVNQVSNSHKTIGKITVPFFFYILYFIPVHFPQQHRPKTDVLL